MSNRNSVPNEVPIEHRGHFTDRPRSFGRVHSIAFIVDLNINLGVNFFLHKLTKFFSFDFAFNFLLDFTPTRSFPVFRGKPQKTENPERNG